MATRLARRRLSRPVRIGLWSLAGLIGLVVAGGAIFALSFDPDSLKPRIVAAVKRATGRDLTLRGPIRLGLSLQPTLVVRDVSLANPPGFSRPQMATLEELDLKLALLPLLNHRVEIVRLALGRPDIILETDAQGRANWQFAPEADQGASQPGTAGAREKTETDIISASDVRIEDGTITWRDGRSGGSAVISLTSLRASAASPEANLSVAMSASYDRTPFTLGGEFGPLAHLLAASGGSAWPVQAHLEAAGAKIAVDGTIAQPLQARGYAMKLTATVPDLAALAPLLPGVALPPLRDISLAAQVADAGAALPDLSSLTLHVGPSDLSGTVAGLKLDRLDVAAARLDQPVKVSAQGSFGNTPATLTGTVGAPAALMAGAKAAGPVPIDISMQALGSSLAIRGAASQGKDGRPSLHADITSDTLDADSLAAALRQASSPRPSATAAAVPSAPPAAAKGRTFPDTPIPFGLLKRADADVKLKIGELRSGGAIYRAIAAHMDLRDGRLRLDPVAADLPEGHLDAALNADATQAVPTVGLHLQAPRLAMQSLLAALGEPGYITGNLQVQADLHGAGATPHAIAASLDGSMGLAMTNGTVDNRILGSTLGSILRETNLLDLVGRGGTSQVRCFVARLDAHNGIATVRPLVFASSLLTMEGDGSLNLGAETLDLRLRPQARVIATAVVVPLRVSGPFRSPTAVPDPAAAIAENAGTVAGTVLGSSNPLGLLAGALGGKNLLSGGTDVDCGAALAAVHAAPGAAAPAAQSEHPLQQLPKLPNVGGVLKQLLR
jgi:uncharacterized protein involved in outer membrane biogenesis